MFGVPLNATRSVSAFASVDAVVPQLTTPGGVLLAYETMGSPSDPPALFIMGFGTLGDMADDAVGLLSAARDHLSEIVGSVSWRSGDQTRPLWMNDNPSI